MTKALCFRRPVLLILFRLSSEFSRGSVVKNLYIRDSLRIDTDADEQTRCETPLPGSDRIGKVFIVVGQDVRKCLICDQLFTRRAASEHATAACQPIS